VVCLLHISLHFNPFLCASYIPFTSDHISKVVRLLNATFKVGSKSTSLSYRTDTEFFHIVIWFKLSWVSVTVSCIRHMGSLMKKSCFLSLIGENGGGISSCVTFLIVAFPYSGHFSINVILSWGNDLWLLRCWLCCDWSMSKLLTV